MQKTRPDEHWEIIEQEKVKLTQGFRLMPEAEFEIMATDKEKQIQERTKK
jgi:hypothetical protein